MLRIFGLAKARRRRQYPQRCCRCFASPSGLPSAGLSPFGRLPRLSNAGQAKKTRNPRWGDGDPTPISGESRKGRLAALLAQSQPAAGMLLCERLAIRPFLLLRGFS